MKTLIVYSSKTGTTQKCAVLLDNKLKEKQDTTLVNVKDFSEDVSLYDNIIIGSPIRMGKIQKPVKIFMEKYQNILKDKNLYIFFCCSSDEFMEKYIKDNIPPILADQAKIITSFGGEIDFEHAKGLDKLVLNMVAKDMKKNNKKAPYISHDNIDLMCKKVLEI